MTLPLQVGFFVVDTLRQAERQGPRPLVREVHGPTDRTSVTKKENGGAEKMANESRVKITLVCTECKQRNYDTKKNKKNDPDRLEMKKHCRFCRKHTLHKESK